MAKALGCFHVEADMFHVRDGEYRFSPERIAESHAWCVNAARNALIMGLDVVVSNTFTQAWEVLPYRKIAQDIGADIEIIVASGGWQNTHDVPVDTLAKMRARWEESV